MQPRSSSTRFRSADASASAIAVCRMSWEWRSGVASGGSGVGVMVVSELRGGRDWTDRWTLLSSGGDAASPLATG